MAGKHFSLSLSDGEENGKNGIKWLLVVLSNSLECLET